MSTTRTQREDPTFNPTAFDFDRISKAEDKRMRRNEKRARLAIVRGEKMIRSF